MRTSRRLKPTTPKRGKPARAARHHPKHLGGSEVLYALDAVAPLWRGVLQIVDQQTHFRTSRKRPDQGIQWSWRDLNPRLPRCERCGQTALTRGNGTRWRVCGAHVEQATKGIVRVGSVRPDGVTSGGAPERPRRRLEIWVRLSAAGTHIVGI